MKLIKLLCLSLFLSFASLSPAMAENNKDPLFVLLTSNDAHRTKMAIGMSNNQFGKGHPLTIYLVDQGVMLASNRFEHKYAEHQKMLKSIMAKGGEGLCVAGERGDIVGASDRDRHRGAAAVRRRHGKTVAHHLPFVELIEGAGGGVSPRAGGVDAELAVDEGRPGITRNSSFFR